MMKTKQKKIELPSLEKDEKPSYVKPMLIHFGSIVSLTSGTSGSVADSCGPGGPEYECTT